MGRTGGEAPDGYGSPAWAALIAQIRRDPANGELRNVAADYLIEHEDPRGEFIVLRDRLARGAVAQSEYVAVYERFRELERDKPWTAQLEAIEFPNMQRIPPFTGFMERAVLDGSNFDRLPELCRHEPVTKLSCSSLGTLSNALLAMPELVDIVELDLYAGAESLLASSNLGKARDVSLWDLTDELVGALAASIVRPFRLHLTTAEQNRDSALARLARSPVLDELRALPYETDDAIDALGDHALPALARLDTTKLSPASIERLARNFDQLDTLRVGMNAIATIIANVRSGKLRHFMFVGEIDTPVVADLIDSQACLALETLAIRGDPLPLPIEQAIRRLAFHGHLREVTVEARRGGRIQIPGVHVIEAA